MDETLENLLSGQSEQNTDVTDVTDVTDGEQSGQIADKSEEGASLAPQSVEPSIDHPALIAERRRRQDAENQLREYQATDRQKQANVPPPSLWEDGEDAWADHITQHATQRAYETIAPKLALDMSERFMQQQHQDFADVKAEFIQMATANPELERVCMSDPNPWGKAYQIVQNQRAAQNLGTMNVTEMEARLREKILSEMQGGGVAQSIPNSLASNGTGFSLASPPQRNSFSETSLEELLRVKK
jgi:hypothetical protein